MMNVYQSQAKTKSFNNTDMPAKGVLKRRVDNRLTNTFFLQGIHNNTFNALYIIKYICIQIHNKMNTNWV